MPVRVQLKPGQGRWFAAGREFEQALGELSDAAFKLFAWVCLRAELASGRLEFERAELARSVGKSRSSVGRCLRELERAGVCVIESAANQHGRSRLQVCPAYWPYQTRPEPMATRSGPGPEEVEAAEGYVARVRQLFGQPLCVQGRFGVADERLARQWQRTGVSLAAVRRAILLGSVRKSQTMLAQPQSEPIRSLQYFVGPLAEACAEAVPSSYWRHLELQLGRYEQSLRRGADASDPACANLARADAAEAGGGPSFESLQSNEEETG